MAAIMTIDRARILTDLSEMLAYISEGPRPGNQITRRTKLVGDLGLQGTGIANLAGRVKSHYGTTANLVPIFTSCNFFPSADAGPLRDLQVGELVDYLAGIFSGTQVNRAAATGVTSAVAGTPFVPPAPQDPGTIIIGSGRCGSTMLSRFIAGEPQTLSVSESLVRQLRVVLNRDPDVEMSGGEYWALLSTPAREPRELRHRSGWIPEQFSYPETGRYAGDWTFVPPILQITLPQLTADPDRLFDRLDELVPRFPQRTALDHHKMLLDLITNLTGKRRWVERTGGASDIAAPLLRTFRDAKIVYLTRNIPDTALSMSKHPAFQMTIARDVLRTRYGVDPLAPRPKEAAGPAEPPHRISWQALREVGRDVRRYECMVAHRNGCAEQALIDVQPRHLHRVRYEDIVGRPAEELTSLGEFLGFADPARWAARVAGQVRQT